MNQDEIKRNFMVPRGNNKSTLQVMYLLLAYRALFGEEKFKDFLEALDKDMKKDGLNLKNYLNMEESK